MNETLWLVVNRASGSNDDAALDGLLAAFEAARCPPSRVIDASADDLPDRQLLEREGVATLAVFTGDGTINAVVPPLEGWGGAVLILPGGTANLLAHALHGEREAAEIVARFGAGELVRQRRTSIRSSQGTALCEVLAGPGATWSDVREGLRDGDLAATASKAVEAMRQSAGGPRVVLAAPELGSAEGYAGIRLAPLAGGMQVDGYGAESAADVVKQGVALLRRNFREGPHDELGTHAEALCRSLDGSPIELMIDGERRTGGPAERFSLAPLEVDLLSSLHG